MERVRSYEFYREAELEAALGADRSRAREVGRLVDRAVRSSINGVVITDARLPDNPIVYVNPGFEQMTGYPAEEAIGKNCRFLQNEDRDQPALKELREAIREGRECRVVLRNYKKDGTLFWNELSVSPVRDEKGRLVNFVGVQNDITERKQAEEELRESEERFRVTFEQAAVGVAHVGLDGRWLRVNRKLCEIVGYEREELLQKTFQDITHPDDLDTDLEYVRRLLAGEMETYSMEKRYFKKDGSIVWIYLTVSLVRSPSGEPRYFISVIEDITKRKRVEEALQYQLDLTRTMTNNAADSLFLWDAEGRVTFMNPAAERTFGWSQEELLGEVLHERMHHHRPDGRPYPISQCPLVRVFESGRTLRDHEDVFFRKDGTPVEVSCSHAPIVVEGEITGAVLVVRDITERKRVEKALREQTETLEKVNRIGRLLASELDLQRLVQAVTDEATELTGARFGAFFYNVVDDRGEYYTLYTISGAPREAFSKFPMPRKTEIFGPTFEGEGVVRAADIREDPRYGNNPPYNGMPEGHLPVVGYLAVPVVSRSGEVLGGLFFGHPEAGIFGEREEQLAVGLAAQAAIAIDNARLFESMRESEDRLSLAVESTGLGTWDFNPVTGGLRWDDRCKAMFGLPPEAEVDYETFLKGLHPEDRQRTDRAVQRSLDPASGGGYDIEYRTVGIEDGVERWVAAQGQAFFDEAGRAVRFTGTVLDITERKRAEEALRQSELLYRTVIKQAVENIFLVDVETRRIVESNPAFRETLGYAEEEFRGMTLYDIVAADRKSIDANIRRVLNDDAFVGERKYRRKDGSLVEVEVSASTILRNGRETLCVVAHDVTERKKNEEAQRFLAEASASLSSSLDYRATLARVARLAVPYLADWCVVDMLEEDGSLERLALAHQDPEKVALARELEERYPPDPEARHGVPQVLRTGRPELVSEIAESLLDEGARDAEHRELLRKLGLKSYMIVPLVARGRTLGAITLVSAESGRRYGPKELELAEELARRSAFAVDNARLYRGRSEIARTLQGSLLPSRLPEVPGVDVGLRYLPAGEVEVGGDFYDLFDARIDGEPSEPSSSWGVVIGDVCGKGAEAAAMLALARHTIRAVAMRETHPSAILAGLNEAMLRQRRERDDHKFCTIAYARLETGEGGAEHGPTITVSCGGHSAPFLLEADGSIRKVRCSGRALGVFDDANFTEQYVRLAPGDALVLYTDGVVEARAPDGTFFGEERLTGLLRASVGLDASTLAGRIESAVLGFQENDPRDDVAVLVLRVPE